MTRPQLNIGMFVAVSALALALTACGGGGGGPASTPGPAPTPSPSATPTPPPTGVNDDLLPTLASETFVNLAVKGSATLPKNGSDGTHSSGDGTVVFSYEASTGTYTVTSSGRTQSFAAAHKDGALSNEQLSVYLRQSGSTTDSLALSNPGTDGALTYRYVGTGFWQRTIESSSSISATLDAFVYGVPTTDADVPRTGSGFYEVALQGVHAYRDGVTSMVGDGDFLVNFASGAIEYSGYGEEFRVDGSSNGIFYWDGTATLSSSSNSFAGQMQLGALTGLSLRGMFFGPDAAEVGAVFRGGTESSVVGTLTGRYGGEVAPVLLP